MHAPASLLTWLHLTDLSSRRSDPLRVQEDADHREECSWWQEPKTQQAQAEGMKGGNRFKAGGISGSRNVGKINNSFFSTSSRSIYQKFREVDLLDKKKTVTALKPGEDRAILLGLGMILSSVMLYFVLGITILRSYAERYRPDISFSRTQCREWSCLTALASFPALNRIFFQMSPQRVDGGGRVHRAQRHGHGGRELLLQLRLGLLEGLQVPLPAGLRERQQHGPSQPLGPQRGDARQQLRSEYRGGGGGEFRITGPAQMLTVDVDQLRSTWGDCGAAVFASRLVK